VPRATSTTKPATTCFNIAPIDEIKTSYQIEHAMTLQSNMGLAHGLNLLIQNLCQPPCILLLEEDWLYLDDLAAPQTTE
jgi:hypothetical protein